MASMAPETAPETISFLSEASICPSCGGAPPPQQAGSVESHQPRLGARLQFYLL
jgi:hypothetical protein